MKTAQRILSVSILVIALLGFAQSQQQPTEEELIVGTWHIEENPSDYLFVVNNDYTATKEYGGDFETDYYSWQITESQTPSGLTVSHLILTNIANTDEQYDYEIDTLNNERLVLIYQRPGGGIGKLTTYLRQ
ncbi:hypothetical protein [Mangrovimonas spongiae]|uniref:Lipocalin-like domain-containing protein n=1 Tax=Mangrovimonas spongiae TaxID=2494697 RepID=A0A3R9N923_9FLAO|nr:hypothetical protein [Mangrovimonas spongiae]RSK41774.1 hypothetical protein EJA19_02525 [Mangrovimonas spongiae]